MDRKKVCQSLWEGDSGIKKEFPEGQEDYDPRLGPYLTELVGDIIVEHGLVEVGCGSGRLAKYFSDDEYLGVDINKDAIAKALKTHKYHQFKVVGYEEEWPKAQCYLFHTVLLHIPDEFLPGIVSRCGKSSVVIAETMDPQFRDGTYTFHRSSLQYKVAFESQGFKLVEERRMYMDQHPGYWDLQKYVFGGASE